MIYIALTGPPSVPIKNGCARLLPSYVSRRQPPVAFSVAPDRPLLYLGSRCDSPELYPPLISPCVDYPNRTQL